MVNPLDSGAQLLGIASPSANDADGRRRAPALFTAALLRAGKHGCTCEACGILQELADIMVADVRSPFPAPTPQPAPAPAPVAAQPPAQRPPAQVSDAMADAAVDAGNREAGLA